MCSLNYFQICVILNVLRYRLCTSCDNAPHGCNAVLKLDSLASHLVECKF